eukprot:COSAG01_NODE_155_length_23814_cov_12.061343_19_plen_70_part_00
MVVPLVTLGGCGLGLFADSVRRVAATAANDVSSRSHSIFMVNVETAEERDGLTLCECSSSQPVSQPANG